MPKFRVIPRLEVKGPNVVKGIRMEGLRVVGQPEAMAQRYAHEGADEIVFVDIVASLYNRNQLHSLVSHAARNIALPLCVGGGVRSIEDIRALLRSGADRISINTQACATPEIIDEAARIFGAQCIALSIQAKRQPDGSWEAYANNGRDRTGREVVTWAREAVSRGAGEILLVSVDRDGTRKGFDLDLVGAVVDAVSVPVVVGGGAGSADDIVAAARHGAAGVVVAHVLHFERVSIAAVKAALAGAGIPVRRIPQAAPA
ncbi:MAG: imidazole glycerol phosphate synthase subunit HisF [Alphaproteobacteria bacterium]|nr:imidazole glycerol phosphate synthase subunit HisF [Alphaproteobacteria bacterium]